MSIRCSKSRQSRKPQTLQADNHLFKELILHLEKKGSYLGIDILPLSNSLTLQPFLALKHVSLAAFLSACFSSLCEQQQCLHLPISTCTKINNHQAFIKQSDQKRNSDKILTSAHAISSALLPQTLCMVVYNKYQGHLKHDQVTWTECYC